ncbi:class I SAM-dependent methyltransferase [Allochromatium humboldtianum]|uniref:Class I SAM-dependent methyltransferase n=1 Tax=Allochromatium humboldtianum TaxID=504901 RepID=A0A850R7R7_9GAMM|nr:class I SAM-dependent methyltransferase [Allochromatium humboldtianum]NVZ08426.1 class I SAM-dependent methyltransferase [Allochromatium humboldtianum]
MRIAIIDAWRERWRLSPVFQPERLASRADYAAPQRSKMLEQRRTYVSNLTPADQQPFSVPGYCQPCQRQVALQVDFAYAYPVDGRLQPNWRERLLCPHCRLNSRIRATLHLFERFVGARRRDLLYLTEQNTSLYRWMADRYPNLTGSEYLGSEFQPGQVDARGWRHEDLTRLSFADASLSAILSFDVLEHVPDYPAAARECLRCLKPGGVFVFSVPFIVEAQETLVRARLGSDGQIEHLHPPEYHGDPVSDAGCLCYYHFGWELLDQLRDLGFVDVTALDYWSAAHGYLGGNTLLFTARKPAVSMISFRTVAQT